MLNKPVDEIIYDESGHVVGVKSEGSVMFFFFEKKKIFKFLCCFRRGCQVQDCGR